MTAGLLGEGRFSPLGVSSQGIKMRDEGSEAGGLCGLGGLNSLMAPIR
jgi:hypothetical protein